jgi:hypothetical protein
MSLFTLSDNADADDIKSTKIPNLKEQEYALLGGRT